MFMIDPVLRFFLLTISPISVCCCRNQHRLKSRAEKRLVKELDVRNLLPKVRNANVIMKGLVRKEYLDALKFSKSSVISPDHPTDSSGDELSSEGEHYSTNQKVKLAIVRGLKIDNMTKTQLKNNVKQNNMKDFWLTLAGEELPGAQQDVDKSNRMNAY